MFIIGTPTSGSIPTSVPDGDSFDLSLDGGEREGSDCFLTSFSEVFSTNTRDLCVISISYGAAALISRSTVVKQKDLIDFSHLLARSFLQIVGNYV
jgi:hypothetical protein